MNIFNKRILIISLFLIFFTCVQSVVAVSDIYCSSNQNKNYLSSDAILAEADLISSDFYVSVGNSDLSSDESTGLSNSVGRINDFNFTNSSDLANGSMCDSVDLANGSMGDSVDWGNDSNSSVFSILGDDSNLNSDTLIANDSYVNSRNLNSTNSTKPVQNSKSIVIPSNVSITSAYIQNILDNAESGSTILFAGSFYKNLNLKINKSLNIISKSGTVINMTFNLPVFSILKGGSGTNISGFTANIADSFVEASDVSDISISDNKIFTKRTAILLKNVFDSKLQNNQFLRFKTALDISKSGGLLISKNNITPDTSYNVGINLQDINSDKKISVLNNRIIGFDSRRESTGIHCGANVRNLLIQGNVIDEWYTAINFTNSLTNVNILNNTLRYNGDGVVINGWISNFTFNKNVVTNTGRIGVHFDDDFRGSRGNFSLENNFFTKSGHLDLKNTGSNEVYIGKNFAKFRCNRVIMKYGYKIKTRQNGNSYYFSIVDENGRAVKGLPNFYATINLGGNNYDVFFVDSVAYFENGNSDAGESAVLDIGEDKRKLSDWGETQELSSLDYYKKLYQDLLDSMVENQTSSDSSEKYDDVENDPLVNDYNGTGSLVNHGDGGGYSGISDGISSVSSNSNSAGSSGSSSISPSSSASSSSPSSVTVKSLSIDEETFRVAGVNGLVFLIICVIGLYYREDILDMIKK